MKTVVLHIGYPKTGTSSLQWFLNAHRGELRDQGFCYPETGQADDHAHHQLAFSLGANENQQWQDNRARLFRGVAAEIEASAAHTLILSSEIFLGNLERLQESTEFAGIAQGCAVRVICFVRRQATFLESLYRQFIWDPNVRFAGSPEAFVEAYPVAGDYHGPLSVWAGWVGRDNLLTEVYEQAMNAGGCIKRFCERIGVDTSRLSGDDFDVRRRVADASAVATGLMRTINGISSLSSADRIELARRATEFAEVTSHLPLPKGLFAAEDVARIEAAYLDSNRRLAEDFVRQPLDGYWFREQVEELRSA